jgi:glycosyltransferase involved in cell wall biosynthesis
MIHKNNKWTGGPLVSVVIPYYNRADTIDDTLDSLTSQTYQNFETIIVDDGSSEPESVKKFKSLSKHSLKPKLIQQKNQGVAISRNRGIKESQGKYIICLDSDDAVAPTYIEKATILLETNPNISLATTYQQIFGVTNELFKNESYDALRLLRGNMVITAAEFPRAAWQAVGGYKSGIGYEDWEFWVSLSEHGYWGKLIPEPLFYYRTAMQSRFVGDKEAHWTNIKSLQKLHPSYQNNIKKLLAQANRTKKVTEPSKALINFGRKNHYKITNERKNILILVPWLTFGGAETLILNFCREVCHRFNLTFMTGLESGHEWEYKFQEITDRIYHLANLFEDEYLYLEFISNYITTRDIEVVHIIHTAWAFPLLAELKQRHPKVKVVVTLFNDRAHFQEAMEVNQLIDGFTSDNNAVYRHYRQILGESADIRVIANAVNTTEIYNPLLYDRKKHRADLGLGESDVAVFFIGRLAVEKNPDVFLRVAGQMVNDNNNLRFFVIGDGPMAEQIKKMIADINSDHVRYLGYKAEVASYLRGADIFVLPSSIEGFPLSILEAMAMKVAVVASDVGAVAEVVEDGKDGFVVKPGSVEEIVSTVERLANDHDLLKLVKKNGRQKVESKYSNVILGRNYKKLYEDFSK